MKRRFPLLALVGVLATSAFAQPNVEALVREFRGQEKAQTRTAEQQQAAYEQVLDSLLVTVSDETNTDDAQNKRAAAQQTLQDIALRTARPNAEAERAPMVKALLAKLPTTQNVYAKTWLIRQLQWIGRADAVAGLTPLLADAQIQAARSRFSPAFNAYAEYERKENDQNKAILKKESRYGMEFAWNLYNGGGDIAMERSALHTRSAAQNHLLDLQRTVDEAVRNAWVQLLNSRARAEMFRSQAQTEGQYLDKAKKEREIGGETSLTDLLLAENNWIAAQIGVTTAEFDQSNAAFDLLFAMAAWSWTCSTRPHDACRAGPSPGGGRPFFPARPGPGLVRPGELV